MMLKRQKSSGFTLLEVLLAVAVLAIISVGLYNVSGSNIMAHQRIQDKTLAHWVALNKVVELQHFDAYPSIGLKKYEAKMAGEEWRIQAEASATDHKDVRQVRIEVGKKGNGGQDKLTPITDLMVLVKKRQ
ncbi:MAG: type II secretion system minor pseudopilin GspI [Gammaproteobacteria bacterium]|nr:type II secretion system minor pseudopilin GspI [Gammaproteobacteria bacterium]